MRKQISTLLFVLPSAVFFCVFFILPLILLGGKSLQDGSGSFTLTNYTEIITNPYYFRALKNSIFLSLSVSFASLTVGGLMAFYLARSEFRLKALLISVLSFPVSLPGVVVGFMIIILFGNMGVVPNLMKTLLGESAFTIAYTQTGIFLAYLYFIIPRTTIILYGSIVDFDVRLEEAARTIGATESQTVFKVVLPTLMPVFASAGILAFSTATSAFGTAFTLANQFDIMPIVMYNEYTMSFRIGKASAMAIVIGVICFALSLVYRRLIERKN